MCRLVVPGWGPGWTSMTSSELLTVRRGTREASIRSISQILGMA